MILLDFAQPHRPMRLSSPSTRSAAPRYLPRAQPMRAPTVEPASARGGVHRFENRSGHFRRCFWQCRSGDEVFFAASSSSAAPHRHRRWKRPRHEEIRSRAQVRRPLTAAAHNIQGTPQWVRWLSPKRQPLATRTAALRVLRRHRAGISIPKFSPSALISSEGGPARLGEIGSRQHDLDRRGQEAGALEAGARRRQTHAALRRRRGPTLPRASRSSACPGSGSRQPRRPGHRPLGFRQHRREGDGISLLVERVARSRLSRI
jgi:hypothetical protein